LIINPLGKGSDDQLVQDVSRAFDCAVHEFGPRFQYDNDGSTNHCGFWIPMCVDAVLIHLGKGRRLLDFEFGGVFKDLALDTEEISLQKRNGKFIQHYSNKFPRLMYSKNTTRHRRKELLEAYEVVCFFSGESIDTVGSSSRPKFQDCTHCFIIIRTNLKRILITDFWSSGVSISTQTCGNAFSLGNKRYSASLSMTGLVQSAGDISDNQIPLVKFLNETFHFDERMTYCHGTNPVNCFSFAQNMTKFVTENRFPGDLDQFVFPVSDEEGTNELTLDRQSSSSTTTPSHPVGQRVTDVSRWTTGVWPRLCPDHQPVATLSSSSTTAPPPVSNEETNAEVVSSYTTSDWPHLWSDLQPVTSSSSSLTPTPSPVSNEETNDEVEPPNWSQGYITAVESYENICDKWFLYDRKPNPNSIYQPVTVTKERCIEVIKERSILLQHKLVDVLRNKLVKELIDLIASYSFALLPTGIPTKLQGSKIPEDFWKNLVCPNGWVNCLIVDMFVEHWKTKSPANTLVFDKWIADIGQISIEKGVQWVQCQLDDHFKRTGAHPEIFVLPCIHEQHWQLIVLDKRPIQLDIGGSETKMTHAIWLIDSLISFPVHPKQLSVVKTRWGGFLQHLGNVMTLCTNENFAWIGDVEELGHLITPPTQHDGSLCGVAMLLNIREIMTRGDRIIPTGHVKYDELCRLWSTLFLSTRFNEDTDVFFRRDLAMSLIRAEHDLRIPITVYVPEVFEQEETCDIYPEGVSVHSSDVPTFDDPQLMKPRPSLNRRHPFPKKTNRSQDKTDLGFPYVPKDASLLDVSTFTNSFFENRSPKSSHPGLDLLTPDSTSIPVQGRSNKNKRRSKDTKRFPKIWRSLLGFPKKTDFSTTNIFDVLSDPETSTGMPGLGESSSDTETTSDISQRVSTKTVTIDDETRDEKSNISQRGKIPKEKTSPVQERSKTRKREVQTTLNGGIVQLNVHPYDKNVPNTHPIDVKDVKSNYSLFMNLYIRNLEVDTTLRHDGSRKSIIERGQKEWKSIPTEDIVSRISALRDQINRVLKSDRLNFRNRIETGKTPSKSPPKLPKDKQNDDDVIDSLLARSFGCTNGVSLSHLLNFLQHLLGRIDTWRIQGWGENIQCGKYIDLMVVASRLWSTTKIESKILSWQRGRDRVRAGKRSKFVADLRGLETRIKVELEKLAGFDPYCVHEVTTRNKQTLMNSISGLLTKVVTLIPILNLELEKASREKLRRERTVVKEKSHLWNHQIPNVSSRNDCGLSWEHSITDLDDDVFDAGSLTKGELLTFGNIIRSKGTVTVRILLSESNMDLTRSYLFDHKLLVNEILSNFPVLAVTYQRESLLVDLHSLSVDGEWFKKLCYPDSVLEAVDFHLKDKTENVNHLNEKEKPRERRKPSGNKPGRKRTYFHWPQLIPETLKFIKSNSFSAQERRRTGTINIGVSLPQIQEHLYQTVPGLKVKGIDVRSIRHLMKPPRSALRSSIRYFGVIDANIPSKRNDIRKINKDGHYSMAASKLLDESLVQFPDEVIFLSADRKAKLKVGPPAVSRYHQIQRFFHVSDTPNYGDHDFNFPGYLLDLSGFMERDLTPLQDRGTSLSDDERYRSHGICIRGRRPLSDSETVVKRTSRRRVEGKYTWDRLGRKHLFLPTSGPSHLTSRSAKFSDINHQTNANDLRCLIQKIQQTQDKHVFSVMADGGSDYQLHSLRVLISMGRVFRDLELEALWLYCNAGGLSAYNIIEHLWSYISKVLCGVSFPATLTEEKIPPCNQRNLTPDEREDKERSIFSKSLDMLDQALQGRKFDGHTIYHTVIECGKDDTDPFNYYTDFKEIASFVESGPTKTKRDIVLGKLLDEFRQILLHVDRRKYALLFNTCKDKTCVWPNCIRSMSGDPKAPKFRKFMDKLGGVALSPKPSRQLPGHYETFLEMMGTFDVVQSNTCNEDALRSLPTPDLHCPSKAGWTTNPESLLFPGRCNRTERCSANYCFYSKTDKQKHDKMFHQHERDEMKKIEKRESRSVAKLSSCSSTFSCRIKREGKTCGEVFSSHHFLAKHVRDSHPGQKNPYKSRKTVESKKDIHHTRPLEIDHKLVESVIGSDCVSLDSTLDMEKKPEPPRERQKRKPSNERQQPESNKNSRGRSKSKRKKHEDEKSFPSIRSFLSPLEPRDESKLLGDDAFKLVAGSDGVCPASPKKRKQTTSDKQSRDRSRKNRKKPADLTSCQSIQVMLVTSQSSDELQLPGEDGWIHKSKFREGDCIVSQIADDIGFEISEIVNIDRRKNKIQLWWFAPKKKGCFDSTWQRLWKKHGKNTSKWVDTTELSELGVVLKGKSELFFDDPSSDQMEIKPLTLQRISSSSHINWKSPIHQVHFLFVSIYCNPFFFNQVKTKPQNVSTSNQNTIKVNCSTIYC
jgi:hypothetical protein